MNSTVFKINILCFSVFIKKVCMNLVLLVNRLTQSGYFNFYFQFSCLFLMDIKFVSIMVLHKNDYKWQTFAQHWPCLYLHTGGGATGGPLLSSTLAPPNFWVKISTVYLLIVALALILKMCQPARGFIRNMGNVEKYLECLETVGDRRFFHSRQNGDG